MTGDRLQDRSRSPDLFKLRDSDLADRQPPPGEEVRRMLLGAEFRDVWVEDTSAHYLAGGQRSA
jgi:hypothetical protein